MFRLLYEYESFNNMILETKSVFRKRNNNPYWYSISYNDYDLNHEYDSNQNWYP